MENISPSTASAATQAPAEEAPPPPPEFPRIFTPVLKAPLRDVNAWARHFTNVDIPIKRETALAIEAMRLNEDEVDAHNLAELIRMDPLMSLKVMALLSRSRPSRMVTPPETVLSTLVMMGISPFFRKFGPQPTLEDRLEKYPEALEGLQEVLRRAHRSANFALSFAVHRMDDDAEVVHLAALLHDCAEMLLWCHAPELALRIRNAQKADASLRSSVVQTTTLNCELLDLSQALFKLWRLPDLLIQATDDKHAEKPQVHQVKLAVQIARHTAQQGWYNAAMPDDVAELSEFLQLSKKSALQLLQNIDF